jgi:hypothetical protein
MIANILQQTPVWVWVVFCGLLVLGVLQTRTRDVSRARATVLPLVMVALSLSGVLGAFGLIPLALGAWILGLWVTLRLAAPWVAVRGATWSSATGHFRVPGSWLPLTLILGIFLTKYVAGVCMAISPMLASNATFAIVLSLVYGLFAGLFWGRARSLHVLIHDRGVMEAA